MISTDLLEILRCPQTLQRVRLATGEEIAAFAQSSQSLRETSLSGGKTPVPLEAGLIREDGKVLYPIRNGIPVMLLEEAICIG